MLSIVCWKWAPSPGYRSTFGPEAVNVLAKMVARYYHKPHRVVCVTDDPKGIDPSISIVPLWDDLSSIQNPHGSHQPSCYRRLKAFSVEAEQWFGPRFVSVDLDCVILRDMSPLWDRPEEFVIWGSGTDRRAWCNGSMWMMTAGARRQVWETFRPRYSPGEAKRAGNFGSDQGWIAYCLGRKEAMWTKEDGVYSFRVHLNNGSIPPPDNARIIFFHGRHDPWSYHCQQIPWIQEAWK